MGEEGGKFPIGEGVPYAWIIIPTTVAHKVMIVHSTVMGLAHNTSGRFCHYNRALPPHTSHYYLLTLLPPHITTSSPHYLLPTHYYLLPTLPPPHTLLPTPDTTSSPHYLLPTLPPPHTLLPTPDTTSSPHYLLPTLPLPHTTSSPHYHRADTRCPQIRKILSPSRTSRTVTMESTILWQRSSCVTLQTSLTW